MEAFVAHNKDKQQDIEQGQKCTREEREASKGCGGSSQCGSTVESQQQGESRQQKETDKASKHTKIE